jgi:hypothetical protein
MLTARERESNLAVGLLEAARYFMGKADVQEAAVRIGAVLDAMGIPYALAGGLAVGVHGYQRMTADVDILISAPNLWKFKERWVGRGWVDRFPGSKNMRDTATGVKVDVLLAGDYPGDGLPKPVRFPNPARVAIPVGDAKVMNLRTLIELKLASGMTAPDRLKDLDDVIHLVRANRLRKSFLLKLNPWVRLKYAELWTVAQLPHEARSPMWQRQQARRGRR